MKRVSLMAVCLLVTCAIAQAADEKGSFLSVTGEAEVNATPDMAVVQAGVVAQADDAKAAQEEVNQKMKKVIDAIKGSDVSEEDIRTSQMTLYPVYEDQRPKQDAEPKIAGYRASNSVQVKVKDLSKVGSVIDAAIGAGANQLNSLQFQLKDDTPARQRALKEAAKAAIDKAKALADAMDVTLGDVVEIAESSVVMRLPQPMYAARAMAADTPVQPGEVAVSASVQIRYRVTAK